MAGVLKESSELLAVKIGDTNTEKGVVKNYGYTNKESPKDPPDGGVMAYSVLVASFITNGLLFGVINSYSVINDVLKEELKNDSVTNFESRASLVGSLAMGTTFFLSPISGVLTGLLGLRLTAVLGGSIAALGLLISSFVIRNDRALCFTYGIMYGLGASFAYTPSLAILGHYFKRHLGIVNGIVCIGSSVFTVLMPTVMGHMINNYGLDWMFVVLAILTVGIALCGLLFKPIPLTVINNPKKTDNSFKVCMRTVINFQIWKNRKYKLWALSIPVALFGYFVPYVYVRSLTHLILENPVESSLNVPLQCIAATSGVGRILFGYLADKPNIDNIMLQQISFYIIGTLTILLPFVRSFGLIIAVALGMGLCDGAFIALLGPIAIELCGRENAAQAIGCMLGLSALPLCLGPPIAGKIFEETGSYHLPFILAGISPLVGATLMFSVRFRGRQVNNNCDRTNSFKAPTSVNIDKRSSTSEANYHNNSL